MTAFEWEQTTDRKEVAALLRTVADGLAKGGEVTLERESWELKLNVPDKVELELELETGGGKGELEIELKWSEASGGARQAAAKKGGRKGTGG